MNVQFAVKDDLVYVLEVNPRASRTVPFVWKAIGVPLAKIAAKVMAGEKLAELGFTEEVMLDHLAVKQPVFPFNKFPGCDIILGPEMRSTGEVMGIDSDLGPRVREGVRGGRAQAARGRLRVRLGEGHRQARDPLDRAARSITSGSRFSRHTARGRSSSAWESRPSA